MTLLPLLSARMLPPCYFRRQSTESRLFLSDREEQKQMSKEEIMSAEQKTERIRESLVDYLICPTHEEYLLIQQNDYWTIRYQGHVALLRSTRGLRYLAVLLRDPGQEF